MKYIFFGKSLNLSVLRILCYWKEEYVSFHSTDVSIPILQEVVGDDTLALQSVLECDEEREKLLKRERELLAKSSADGV